MSERVLHKFEQYIGFMSVTAMFSVTQDSSSLSISKSEVVRALLLTMREHQILRHVISANAREETTPGTLYLVKLDDNVPFDGEQFLEWREYEEIAPDLTTRKLAMVNEARKPMDSSKNLFRLKVAKYSDCCVFTLAVSHSICDGKGIFCIVDTFCESMVSLLDTHIDDKQFAATLASRSELPLRDLVAEVLLDPKVSDIQNENFNTEQGKILAFPALTDSNTDASNNGCIRALFYDFDTATSAKIMANCHTNGVTFQSLLSATAGLAFTKLLHSMGELDDEKWNTPIVQHCPISMRRFLKDADNISACISSGLRWTQGAFGSYDALKERMFWSDLVSKANLAPLRECVDGTYPFQVLARMNNALPTPPFTVMTSSVGAVQMKSEYGFGSREPAVLQVRDVAFLAAFFAQNWEGYAKPEVPAAMINSGMPGYMMLHAYSALSCLHLSCGHFAYASPFAATYYDEIVRILTVAGSETGAATDLKVGDVFTL